MVPRWKLEFLERKKKYEERKAIGGAAGKDEDKEEDSNDEDVSEIRVSFSSDRNFFCGI